MGRHPYSGISVDGSHYELEDNIRTHRYAYNSASIIKMILPPAVAVSPSYVAGPSMVYAFDKAFDADASLTQQRPDAAAWHNMLVNQRNSLMTCVANRRHLYDQSISDCIWCRLQAKGVAYFGPASRPVSAGSKVKPNFAYQTKQDICMCTGSSMQDVDSAATTLGCSEPFSRAWADRIANLLTGDPSIKRAFDRIHNPKSVGWQSAAPSRPYSSTLKVFSYSTVKDICKCTGKSDSEVKSAMALLACREPFSLIDADRLAGVLVGDPSLKRAYVKQKVALLRSIPQHPL
jgi:hypothetical protein